MLPENAFYTPSRICLSSLTIAIDYGFAEIFALRFDERTVKQHLSKRIISLLGCLDDRKVRSNGT